jgi:hypothetical protein
VPARTLPPAPVMVPTEAASSPPAPRAAPPPPAERHIEPAEILEPADAPFRERTATAPPPKPQPAPKPAPPPTQPRARKPVEPKIFVPPHAPDDPGTETAEDDFSAYPTSGAKA